MLLGEIFHTLTLTPPCILYSCQIQYMSCSFHCTSGKDFSLLKKKKEQGYKSVGQLDFIKAYVLMFANVCCSIYGFG